MKKQTATEYLIKEISSILGKIKTTPIQDLLMVEAINKAKAMEKEQMEDMFNNGVERGYDCYHSNEWAEDPTSPTFEHELTQKIMLTGRCQEEFEKWLKFEIGEDKGYIYVGSDEIFYPYLLSDFKELPFSMQYGVYVDFFDSVGIDISIKLCGYMKYDYSIKDKESQSLLFTEYDWSKTRTEARTKAIEKANELFNTKEI